MSKTRNRQRKQNHSPARTAPPRKPDTAVTALTLVKPGQTAPTAKPPLPIREPRPWMTDIQGFATCAALLRDITTPHIRNWHDHGDQTASRPHHDGTLHYTHKTRVLTWIAPCPKGANHTYTLTSPGDFSAAQRHVGLCREDHGLVRSLAAAFAPGRDNEPVEPDGDPAKTQPMSVAQIADALDSDGGEQQAGQHPDHA